LRPDLTINSTTYYVTPKDFQTIYDISSVISGGNTGATIGNVAQHVAIIGRSRVVATDISEFATNTAIGSYNLNTIIPPAGTDPGSAVNGDTGEATLDVNRIIGVATGPQADLVASLTTGGTDGVYIAASYNVNTLVDPVMTISFGSCEASAGSGVVNTYNTLFSTGAAEGISIFVSSGDSGAAGCDAGNAAAPTTTQVLSPNALCASSYVTCVGGTEFNDASSYSTYWNSSNGTGYSSAKSYIPEGAWNEPHTSSPFYVQSTGGGVSSTIAKPSWQTGTGVPAGSFRDTPDVAFSAAGHDGYYSCLASSGGDCSMGFFVAFQGTSAAAPGMAGIAALLNTKMGLAQGNLNPMIYALAASSASSFHDATPTSSGVGACSLSTPSMCNNSTPSNTSLTGGLAGYALTTGYDQATGWGSLDVANFLTAASTAGATSQTITFPQPTSPGTAGSTVALTASSTSGLGIIYTIASGPATIAGSNVTYTGSGSVVLNANQPGNYQYAAATQMQDTVVVNQQTPAVTASTVATATSPTTLTAQVSYTGAVAPTGAFTFQVGTGTITAGSCSGASSPLTCTASYDTSSYGPGAHVFHANIAAAGYFTSALNTGTLKVVNQDVFVMLSGGNTASFYNSGTVNSSATSGGGIGGAVDASGNVWSINSFGSAVSVFTNAGVLSTSYSSGISSGKALAIDGNNQTWIANGNGTLTALTNAGALVFTFDPAGGSAAPGSISVDTAGSLWLSVPGSNSIIEVFGEAGPVATPTVTQVINSTPGTKP
jgi:subtilase family serine protease